MRQSSCEASRVHWCVSPGVRGVVWQTTVWGPPQVHFESVADSDRSGTHVSTVAMQGWAVSMSEEGVSVGKGPPAGVVVECRKHLVDPHAGPGAVVPDDTRPGEDEGGGEEGDEVALRGDTQALGC